MTEIEAMRKRHSVRQYKEEKLSENEINALNSKIDEVNKESGLNIQLITNNKNAFDSFMSHYGKFSGVENYIALVGNKKDKDLDIKVGYYGEKLVLFAQCIGLCTCWVALTFNKSKTTYIKNKDEKLVLIIAIGHGKNHGVPHKSKSAEEVSNISNSSPSWFKSGVEATLLAPTAINQQKFYITDLGDNKVKLTSKLGPYSKLDLGIVKYHFELGAGKENFEWN